MDYNQDQRAHDQGDQSQAEAQSTETRLSPSTEAEGRTECEEEESAKLEEEDSATVRQERPSNEDDNGWEKDGRRFAVARHVAAEVALVLEKTLLTKVFGACYVASEEDLTLDSLVQPRYPKQTRALLSVWTDLRRQLRIDERFGSDVMFYGFVREAKGFHTSSAEYRALLASPIDDIATRYLLRLPVWALHNHIAALERSQLVASAVKRKEQDKAKQALEWHMQRMRSFVQLLKELDCPLTPSASPARPS